MPISSLFAQFAISTAMLVLCVMIHGIGLFSLNRLMHSESSIERLQRISALSPYGAAFTLSVVLALFALHGIEIWAYALLFLGVGAVPDFESALYFSTISYSTVGYHDTDVLPEWRLVGAFESVLGLILLGWSTAFFFRMLGRIDAQ